jgi:hypothetical protein
VVTSANTVTYETAPVAAGGTGFTSIAANDLVYASSANTLTGLASTNSAVLTTNGSGVPAWTTIATDIFTQYPVGAGRSGGQTLDGGTATADNLTLNSTSHASPTGYVLLQTNGGSVGIGNSSPGRILDVTNGLSSAGNGSMRVAGYQAGFEVFNYGGTANWSFANNDANGNALYIGRGYGPNQGLAPNIVISQVGNVGIGTTSPNAPLTVSGHLANVGTSATVTSCGSGPTISGNDTKGVVTIGTGGITSCSVAFNTGYGSTPVCVVTWQGTSAQSVVITANPSTP